MNTDGPLHKYLYLLTLARLVIKGIHQKKGIDYDQIFSSVTRYWGTVRSVLSIAASDEMVMLQFDVTTAFLYGSLDKEMFMKQLDGYNDGFGRVSILRLFIGLKQVPWYNIVMLEPVYYRHL